MVSIGFKAEAAAVIGAYLFLTFNTDFKVITVCLAAGVKIITNAAVSFSAVITYYSHKNVNGLVGWGFSTGISFSVGAKVSAAIGLDVDTNGKMVAHGGPSVSNPSLSHSIAPIPYWDTEFGYTGEIFRRNIAKIGKKRKKYKKSCQRFSIEKPRKNKVVIRCQKKKICIYKTKVRIK